MDTRNRIVILVAVIGAVIGLVALCMYLEQRWEREECRTFCATDGEAYLYSPAYGCYCVTLDGQRYNPGMVGKGSRVVLERQ